MSCPDCFQGHVHEGDATGIVSKLHGFDVYIAEPVGQVQGIIVIVPDAFGWMIPNVRLLADRYAAQSSYRVYAPEFMVPGTAIPYDMISVFRTMYSKEIGILSKLPHIPRTLYATIPFMICNRFSVVMPKVLAFLTALRKNEAAALPLGAVGFCWGGKVVFNLCADTPESRVDGKPLLDAAFAGHPAPLSLPADAEKVRRPLSVANGDHDTMLDVKSCEVIKGILEGREEQVGPDGRYRGELRIYEGVGHGFCVRGDVNVIDIKDSAERAEEQALEWFNKWFAEAGY